MKFRDAIVEEVRKARREYAQKFNFDLDAMCADLQRKEKSSGGQVVSFSKRAEQANSSEAK